MLCPKCKKEVSCLNDTPRGEACYDCRRKLNLKTKPYKHTKISKKELISKEEFVQYKINK